MDCNNHSLYIKALRDELIPALGCTEPIAIAYAAAAARETLGAEPERIIAACSRNIIKNVQGVIVPGTESLRGVQASAVLGVLAGDPSKKLEVLDGVTQEHVERAKSFVAENRCEIQLLESSENLHIVITLISGENTAAAEVMGSHTNLVRLEKNGEAIIQCGNCSESGGEDETDHSFMNLKDIIAFADSFEIEELRNVLDKQIEYNMRIAEEGLRNKYGANVGASLLNSRGHDVRTLACAYPAAGSDARMSGCTLPVIINCGSGNQGMTASLPVIQFAREIKAEEEKLYRSLALSNLVSMYQKHFIGRLSAFCGVVSAACGAGAGIAYLHGGDYDLISDTISNTLANTAGIVCDGAKPSCAAKIATAVNAALMAFDMAKAGSVFSAGEGILGNNADTTIGNVGVLGADGMKVTDRVILDIMLGGSRVDNAL